MTAAYIAAPVGAGGVDKTRARVVLGPVLRGDLPRHELVRRLAAQADELEALKRQLPVAQAAARHMEALRQRMNNECDLRVRYQGRLHVVADGLARIARECPEAAGVVALVRDEIFGIEEKAPADHTEPSREVSGV